MGDIRLLRPRAGTPTGADSRGGRCLPLHARSLETAGTRRVYASTLRQLREHLGSDQKRR